MTEPRSAANGEEFRELHRDFPDLIDRLRNGAMLAKANGQEITGALFVEAADAVEELCAALSEDRQLRWQLRARLDAALARSEEPRGWPGVDACLRGDDQDG